MVWWRQRHLVLCNSKRLWYSCNALASFAGEKSAWKNFPVSFRSVHVQMSNGEPVSSKTEDAMNNSSDSTDSFHRSFGARADFATEAAVPLTNEALLAVLGSGGLTPVSSPHGSTLTRSSSSDSLRSVHGKPGLVRQITQEIEARMRLAGLTVPSRLNRSNSLAKLGSLTFSSEDLCSACSSDAGTLLMLSLSPDPERSLSPEWARPWPSSSTSTSTNMDVFNQGEAGPEESKSWQREILVQQYLWFQHHLQQCYSEICIGFLKHFSHLGTLAIHGRVNMSGRVSYTK